MNPFMPRLLAWLMLTTGLSPVVLAFNDGAPIARDTNQICIDTTQRLLLREDTMAITAGFISKTADGNFLIPGYCYPNAGIYYNMPHLVKCTPAGSVLWSKRYDNVSSFPSQWMTASRVLELQNGDLLMTGEIGVPGTDDRRELAV